MYYDRHSGFNLDSDRGDMHMIRGIVRGVRFGEQEA
jgi:hypothetical protein